MSDQPKREQKKWNIQETRHQKGGEALCPQHVYLMLIQNKQGHVLHNQRIFRVAPCDCEEKNDDCGGTRWKRASYKKSKIMLALKYKKYITDIGDGRFFLKQSFRGKQITKYSKRKTPSQNE